MITFFHRPYHTVDILRHSTENPIETFSFDLFVSSYLNITKCCIYVKNKRTFRLHGCLLQSRPRLHLVSHKNILLHGSSFEWRPQRHFFSIISRHWPHEPLWQRSVQIWLPHLSVFWQVLPHGSTSTVHGACVVYRDTFSNVNILSFSIMFNLFFSRQFLLLCHKDTIEIHLSDMVHSHRYDISPYTCAGHIQIIYCKSIRMTNLSCYNHAL